MEHNTLSSRAQRFVPIIYDRLVHDRLATVAWTTRGEARVRTHKPIRVAVIGGGCASISTAFELTRPEHQGKYQVSVYQLGWRLGGKGASGRGPADRIEEHGLHLWMGFYENAFRLLRECYTELDRDPQTCRIADWRDAFFPDPLVGLADYSPNGMWLPWLAHFPPGVGDPGDPYTDENPFRVQNYLIRCVGLLRTVLESIQLQEGGNQQEKQDKSSHSSTANWLDYLTPILPISPDTLDTLGQTLGRLLEYGRFATLAGLLEAVEILRTLLETWPQYAPDLVLGVIETLATTARHRLEGAIGTHDELRRLWEILDIVLAILHGIVRFNLINDPRGFAAIDDYDWREWLQLNGASQASVNSAFVRGIYDLLFGYEDGDVSKPRMAAGQALRGALRMFFTYRGAVFWKMRAGMGDIVFAPFYEVLKKRGVRFEFFHRLENVVLAKPDAADFAARPYIAALEFDVQAKIAAEEEYQPLIDVRGLPCWPSQPDYAQLVDGDRLQGEGWQFESHWDRRKVGTKTLRVSQDFDFVVLGVGLGAIPFVCQEIVAQDARWQKMIEEVKTVPTQAFQLWMNEDMASLGWRQPSVNLSGFVEPFDTWADMAQLIPEESWPVPPQAIAYFCSVLSDTDPPPQPPADGMDVSYPVARREEVRRNAIRFLNRDIQRLWPQAGLAELAEAKDEHHTDQFRWDVLIDPFNPAGSSPADKSRFGSQYWAANVNPSDRYVLSLPGSIKYRISPLDNTYDNLTITGDWTDCGHNAGCVEAAVMAGRLAAHAIAGWPALEDIVGYDHP